MHYWVPYSISDEHTHRINFLSLIQKAFVRMQYLQCTKDSMLRYIK